MPDNTRLGLSKSKIETKPFFVADLTETLLGPYARHNEGSDPRKMLFPVIVSDKALFVPLTVPFSKAPPAVRILRGVVRKT